MKRGGRIKSQAYRAWQTAAHYAVILQQPGNRMVRPPYRVTISLPTNMRGDIDNRIKATLDLLTRVCAITDDVKVLDLTVRKNCATPGKCAVMVETFGGW